MALTSIAIFANRSEYSKYEEKRSVVKARIVPTPATGLTSETVAVSLEKNGVVIASAPVIFNGNASKGIIVEFNLKDIRDSDGISHINRGAYTISATQGLVTDTQTIKVSMITADEIRMTYCQGLYLVSGLKMAPKRQPSAVTGVTIENVSKGTAKGVYGLIWDKTNKTITWNGGTPIPVTEDSTNEILIDPRGNYVEIELDYFQLPDADAAEGILIDQQELDDYYLQGEIAKASNEVEDSLKVKLEPTRVATEPYFSNPDQGEYFDDVAVPVAYYEHDFNQRGLAWHINMPYHQLNKVTDLVGMLADTKCLELKTGALSCQKKAGLVDVLPHSGQFAMYYTFFMTFNFWGVRQYISNFWRYKANIGVTEKDISELIKMIGYTAAVSILTTAEQAYRAGTTSESISKDGVSRSISSNNKGIYDATIQEYKDWLKDGIPKHRNLLRGIPCVVL
jgi:hypothetical protein